VAAPLLDSSSGCACTAMRRNRWVTSPLLPTEEWPSWTRPLCLTRPTIPAGPRPPGRFGLLSVRVLG